MVSDSDVISEWWTIPEVMERTGVSLQQARRWVQERDVVGLRRGPDAVLMVPAGFFVDDGPLPALRGTITVLADGGQSDEEIVSWLHAPDDSLPGGSALASLHAGAKTEVRRRAQEQAF
ncbi:Rv2175c family DNA-binding protein [Serinicoccus chungangensis]|nr:Rv2175c family DNA-binding protein [Serinicoccus chungangensis]